VRIVNNLDAPGGSRDLRLARLATQDPQVRRLALRWAHGDADLAEDGRHTAYCRVAALKHPERIKNPRAYFLRVLRNEIASQLALRRAVLPVEDLEDAMDPGLSGTAVCGSDPARPIDERVCTSLHIQFVLKRLADEHDHLLDEIPARSDDPDLYKATIFAAAEQVPRDALNGEAADSNAALQKAYPGYFDQSGASPNLRHQRFRRAREDVRAVLLAVVDPDDLA
jgi:DNA-directed RNA polymerase specialized sigma24 family protein